MKQLPLDDAHRRDGARLGPFAGYEMPIRYGTIVDEHLHVRSQAGVFDVSHMGEVFLRGEGAVDAAQRLFTNDMRRLDDGDAIYTAMCNHDGGIIDDLIVYRIDERELLVCVNASRRAVDFEWIARHVGDDVEATDESDDWAQLAIQGPLARAIVDRVCEDSLLDLPRFAHREHAVAGITCRVARTGYTGEDGYEIFVPAGAASALYAALREAGGDELKPIGLGARDTLRLEAGLLLYGSDMNDQTLPAEVGLSWVVKPAAGDFIGRDAIEKAATGGVGRKLIGLRLEGRGVLRGGEEIRVGDRKVGCVTSAALAPSLERACIANAVVSADVADQDRFEVVMRRREGTVRRVPRPFYRRGRD